MHTILKLLIPLTFGLMSGVLYSSELSYPETVKPVRSCKAVLQFFKETGLNHSRALSKTFEFTDQFRRGPIQQSIEISEGQVILVDAILAHLLAKFWDYRHDRPLYHLGANDLRHLPKFQRYHSLVASIRDSDEMNLARIKKLKPVLDEKEAQLIFVWAGKTSKPRYLKNFPIIDFGGSLNPCMRILRKDLQKDRASRAKYLLQKQSKRK